MKDYYEILGISEEEKRLDTDSFNNLCKKKYHSLAMKLHPDRWANGTEEEKKDAESKFKDVAEAYEVLSNPEKRQRYDNGGSDFDFGGFDPMDIFSKMAEMGGGFGHDPFDDFFGGRKQRVNKGSDIHIDINLTLEEAYNGCKKKIRIRKNKKCQHCNGTGFSDGKEHFCEKCNGSGTETEMKQFGRGQFSMTSHPCTHCNGTGKDKKYKKCDICKGNGFVSEYVTEEIDIPVGIANGMAFKVSGMGNAPEGDGINGDLIVHATIKKDSYFERPDNINLIHRESVPFAEALVGFKKEFKCIDGSKVTVNAKELTKDGEAFIFKGKGMPDVIRGRGYGDYAVVINYKLPEKLNDKQRELLKNFYN